MEYSELIERRHSIRKFASKPVEREKLDAILHAANRAPSAGNLQAYEIYVARDRGLKAALAKASLDQKFIAEADVVLAFCTNPKRNVKDYGDRGAELYSLQDTTIACSFATLAVDDVGLATTWVGAFDPDTVRQLIGAPAEQTPVALLPLGYAAERPEITSRRPLDDLVHEI